MTTEEQAKKVLKELLDKQGKNEIVTCHICGKEDNAKNMYLMSEIRDFTEDGKEKIIGLPHFECNKCHITIHGKHQNRK